MYTYLHIFLKIKNVLTYLTSLQEISSFIILLSQTLNRLNRFFYVMLNIFLKIFFFFLELSFIAHWSRGGQQVEPQNFQAKSTTKKNWADHFSLDLLQLSYLFLIL